MPVFRTKTIQSILDPVAQQVSRLVILHEECVDGNAMPDLKTPVGVVKQAVDNLIQVGYETVKSSKDPILQDEMPKALQRVEQAAKCLIDAANVLSEEPYSDEGRKMLIDGSRGILGGTAGLLIALDDSEVRKIISQCKAVQDYVAITQVIETMEDLLTFVKNITPGMARMTKMVEDREKELTLQHVREILHSSLSEIKNMTPLLISSIKTFISVLNNSGSSTRSVTDARQCRDDTCGFVCSHIDEIIRALLITDLDNDDASGAKTNLQAALEAHVRPILNWAKDTQAKYDETVDEALKAIQREAQHAVKRMNDRGKQDRVNKAVGDLKSMVETLKELRENGQGETTQAIMLGRSIEQKMREVVDAIADGAADDGLRSAASALQARVHQSHPYYHNCHMDKQDVQAAKLLISDGFALAVHLEPGSVKDELVDTCNEAEQLLSAVISDIHNGLDGSPEAKETVRALYQKLHQLADKKTAAVASMAVDCFKDVNGPLKALTAAAFAPMDVPSREQDFERCADNFLYNSSKVAEQVSAAARSYLLNGNIPPSTQEAIQQLTDQVNALSPQVVLAARLVLHNPGLQSAAEHFNLVKQQWSDNVARLNGLVDSCFDTPAFMLASEKAILQETDKVEAAIAHVDVGGITENASNIARRANRMLQVAAAEVENCEDGNFQKTITDACDDLKAAVPNMVVGAKALSMDPRNGASINHWRSNNDKVLDSVQALRRVFDPEEVVPDVNQLSLREQGDGVPPPRPPLPAEDELDAPPRPPPPIEMVDQDKEMERVFDTQPHSADQNHPIMVAAQNLHQEVKHWESADNELVRAAKHMALLMAKLSQLVGGEGSSKKELIDTARAIAEYSSIITKLANGIAMECTDKRMRTNLLQVCERVPTIGNQLKILSTVKATMLGSQGSQEDDEATEMLVGNAQNLMQSVKDTVRAAEAASIKIRVQSGFSLRWVRRRPWYSQ